MRHWLGWTSVCVCVAAVLAGGALAANAVVSAPSSRQSSKSETFTVNVDGRNPAVNESFDAYFPNVVTVHAGDTVRFHYVGVGEPHTVTLGTLANDAVSTFDSLKPAQQNNPPKSALAVDAKLPQLLNASSTAVVPAAANPCYLRAGEPSKDGCPATAKSSFDGHQSYYNSGWLKHNETFAVHLSSATPPGTYRFLCLVHREFMQGRITVVAASKAVPSPAAQAALGRKQLAQDEAGLAESAKLLAQGKPPIPGVALPGSHPVLAGSGSLDGADPGQIDEFGPKTVHIPVGGSVTWWLTGVHSITFNSDNVDNDVQTVYKNGDVQINARAAAPAGGPVQSAKPPAGGTQKHIDFKVVAAGSWDGKGFLNSGVVANSQPPNIEGYKLTFTRAGTYKFICTVHDNMKGTIVVGGK